MTRWRRSWRPAGVSSLLNFLGWGQSDKPAGHEFDVASLRRDLEAVIEHFGLKKIVLVVHDSSGQPGIDWTLDNPDRTLGLVLLNTYYAPSQHLVPPPAIANYSTPGILRDLRVAGANRSDGLWQAGVQTQLATFFANPEARGKYLNLFAHQALMIRPAFFGLNRVLRDEVRKRHARLPQLQALRVRTKIVFGTADPFLNVNVAREFKFLISGARLHLIDGAAHYVQLDQPEKVAEIILAATP